MRLITLAPTFGCSGKTENAVAPPGEDGAAGEDGGRTVGECGGR